MGGSTLIRPGHGTCLKDERLLVIPSSHFPLEPNNRTRSATSPSMLRSAEDTVELRETVSETFIIPSKTAPPSRVVIEDYLKRSGPAIIPDHEVAHITRAVS